MGGAGSVTGAELAEFVAFRNEPAQHSAVWSTSVIGHTGNVVNPSSGE